MTDSKQGNDSGSEVKGAGVGGATGIRLWEGIRLRVLHEDQMIPAMSPSGPPLTLSQVSRAWQNKANALEGR